ncbi:DAL1A protein, partial [Machaerirhynchus nigripectus]|nr:DAL1A protein [Machaerirhynchus nigripectus]
VKAGSMRVSKKQENGPVEKNAKPPGKEKSRYYSAGPVHPCPIVKVDSNKIHAATLQVAHQKPQPTLEKFILPK